MNTKKREPIKPAPPDISDRQHDERGRFVQKGKEPLAKKAKSVRLPESIDQLLNQLPSVERSEWLRRVIGEAAAAELSEKKTRQGNTPIGLGSRKNQ